MSDDEDAPPRTFHEEQEELKVGFKAALQDSDSENEDFLKIRPKSETQKVIRCHKLVVIVLIHLIPTGKRRRRI